MVDYLAAKVMQEEAELLAHGDWLGWVRLNCKFSHDMATRYMELASNFQRAENLDSAKSIRSAMSILAPDRHPHYEARKGDPKKLIN